MQTEFFLFWTFHLLKYEMGTSIGVHIFSVRTLCDQAYFKVILSFT